MIFEFDASGAVAHRTWTHQNRDPFMIPWKDLPPFTQGYVEALLSSGRPLVPLRGDSQNPFRSPAFRDLAPETLARIMEDCERMAATYGFEGSRRLGREAWDNRQRGCYTAFPPLTPFLGDDGKVYLREGA